MARFRLPCPVCGANSSTRHLADGHMPNCPLSVPCPDCRRPIGSWCHGPAGHRAMTLHKARRDASGHTAELASDAAQNSPQDALPGL